MSAGTGPPTRTGFVAPRWRPEAPDGARILITGATGGIGSALLEMLLAGPVGAIGAHGASGRTSGADPRIVSLTGLLETDAACARVVDAFVAEAGGIDALVSLGGGVTEVAHWRDLSESAWRRDLDMHLSASFFLSRRAADHFRRQGAGGRIVLNSTASVRFGGGPSGIAYTVAKSGAETLVRGLSRDLASEGVLVNGVRLGFIASGFHERWQGRGVDDIAKRIELVPLKRAGDPLEAAAMITFLLSDWAGFVTGQIFGLTGGE